MSSRQGSSYLEEPVLSIRPAKGFDAAAVAELRARCTSGSAPDPAFTGSMRTWLEAEGEPRITLMASLGERVVGLISMLEHRGMPAPGVRQVRWGYIGHLFVDPPRRGQGVATALICEATAIADRRDYERLTVAPNNMAMALFHRLGFRMADELGPEGIILTRPRPRTAVL